jgi:CheY-like chemotaxis protein
MQRETAFGPAAAGGGGRSGRQPLILVVEDNSTNALILSAMLRKSGYESVVATDGADGVEMMDNLAPALILMDLHMPRLNGFDAAAEIRRKYGDRAPAIVAVTANANPEVHAACLASGFRAVISKPVMIDALIATVREFLPKSDGRAGAAR